MGTAVHIARRPGAEEIFRRRGQVKVCCTPGCRKAPLEGARFCGTHQERLDRIRAELESESSSGRAAERWRDSTTRGMKKGAKEG